MMSLEEKFNQLVVENAQLKASIGQVRVDCAKQARNLIMRYLRLSEKSIARLNAAFANSTDNAGLKEAIKVETNFNTTRPVEVGLVALGQSFRATIWVPINEYFTPDGVLIENKLRNRLSCNMGVHFLPSQPTER